MRQELMDSFTLDGRVALVTGAASGLGREVAVVLAEAGATPVLCDVNEVGLRETADLVGKEGAQAIVCPTNVADRTQMEAAADRAASINGKVDVWVNAAGIIVNRPVLDAVDEEVERMLAVNQKGVYWGCAAAGRIMRASGGGSIVNFSSTGADSAVPGLSLYSMTKAAVNMMTRTVAKEMGQYGIRANAVAPGWVDTPMGNHTFVGADGEIDRAKYEEGVRLRAMGSPLGVVGTARDIGLAVLYLASDASSFVTGQILRVNGGVSMP